MTQQISFFSRRNVRRAALVAMVGMTAGLGGCISQADYDRVLVENRTLTNRNQELRASLDECEAARSALGGTRQTGDQTISQLTAQLNEKNSLLDDYEKRMRQLEQQMQGFSFGALDPVTDAALADLASRYSNLLSYDSAAWWCSRWRGR